MYHYWHHELKEHAEYFEWIELSSTESVDGRLRANIVYWRYIESPEFIIDTLDFWVRDSIGLHSS